MTTYSAQYAVSQTLVGAAEDIVNLSGAYRNVRITNWGAATDIIRFTIGPTAGAGPGPTAPSSGGTGNDSHQLRGAAALPTAVREFVVPGTGAITVRLISAQTPTYSVESYPGVS